MRIGILGQFPDPNDPTVSKAGYRFVTELAKLLSGNNEVTIYPVYKHKLSIDLPFCQVIPVYSSNLIVRWIRLIQRITKDREILDMLIVHNPTISALPVIPLKMLFSIPVVVGYVDKQTAPTYSRLKILRFLSFFSERLFLLTVDSWLTDSNYLENEIKKVRRRANIMLYRGVLLEQHPSAREAKPLPLEIRADYINIAYSGGLTYHHGVDILLHTFSKLPSENVHLYITGFGAAKPTLENIVKEKKLSNVTIAFLDNEVMYDFLSKMDIFVIPYRNTKAMEMIGFASKIIGYMWAGKAIIASNVGDLPDVLEHERTALLIQPENEDTLRRALMDLITDEDKRRKLGLNGRKYFEENFSKEAVKERLTKYLSDVVNLSKKPLGREVRRGEVDK